MYTHGQHGNRYLMSVPIEQKDFEDIQTVGREIISLHSTRVSVYEQEYKRYSGDTER